VPLQASAPAHLLRRWRGYYRRRHNCGAFLRRLVGLLNLRTSAIDHCGARSPAPLNQKLRLRAAQAQRTIEDELLEVLATAVPLTDALPAELSAAITPLATLNDADLWRAAQTQLPANLAARLEELHLKRQREGLTGHQESERDPIPRHL
jgi:plasmid stability protein